MDLPELNDNHLINQQTFQIPLFLKRNISIESIGLLAPINSYDVDQEMVAFEDPFYKNPSFLNSFSIFPSERQSLQLSLNANRIDTEKALE